MIKGPGHLLLVYQPRGMRNGSLSWMMNSPLFDAHTPTISSKTGVIMLVVPKLLGLAIYSPEKDQTMVNSRGVDFCRLLSESYSLSLFDLFMPGAFLSLSLSLSVSLSLFVVSDDIQLFSLVAYLYC